MKSLKNILDNVILEKLSIDSILLDIKFPIDGEIGDIIEFLKEEGFKDSTVKGREAVDKIFDSKKFKCFTLSGNDRIWFADTSKEKVSEKNPIFLITFPIPKNKIFTYTAYKAYKVFYINNDHIEYIIDDNKEKFLEELNKRFGWQ